MTARSTAELLFYIISTLFFQRSFIDMGKNAHHYPIPSYLLAHRAYLQSWESELR